MKKLIAGNWKMNGSSAEAERLISGIAGALPASPKISEKCDFVVCPPFPYLAKVESRLKANKFIALGAQDCSAFDNGAYTGDVSARMLKDMGCSYVIVGHSERRQYSLETDEIIAKKAARAHESGLIAIICVGETEKEREQGQEKAIVEKQLKNAIPKSITAKNTVIAYEPVWAIGTGKTATPEDVKAMHGFIREKLKIHVTDAESVRILYGGSMKPENAAELLAAPNVDGGLIGGASLKAEQFISIAKSA